MTTAREYSEAVCESLQEAMGDSSTLVDWLDDQLEIKPLYTHEGELDHVTITVTIGGPNCFLTVGNGYGDITTHWWGDSHVLDLSMREADDLFGVLLAYYGEAGW